MAHPDPLSGDGYEPAHGVQLEHCTQFVQGVQLVHATHFVHCMQFVTHIAHGVWHIAHIGCAHAGWHIAHIGCAHIGCAHIG